MIGGLSTREEALERRVEKGCTANGGKGDERKVRIVREKKIKAKGGRERI